MGLLSAIPIVGQFIDAAIGAYSNNQQNKANQKMVDRQNEYNSPVNQVARLRQAGLNPAMMYGSGSVANTQSQAPQVNKPAPTNFGSAMASYFDAKLKDVQADNAETQARLMQTQIDKLKQDILRNKVGTESDQFDLDNKKLMQPYQLDASNLRNANSYQNLVKQTIQNSFLKDKEKLILQDLTSRIANAVQTKNLSMVEEELKRLEIQMRQKGTSFSDPIMQRTTAKLLTPLLNSVETASNPALQHLQFWVNKIFNKK
ncbi:MAG TPA: hypothetical protein PLJ18_12355 [Niabella sp.]|nr:hypothetical protein [Niabella sp.]